MQHTFWPSFIAIGLVLFSKNANSYRFSYKAVCKRLSIFGELMTFFTWINDIFLRFKKLQAGVFLVNWIVDFWIVDLFVHFLDRDRCNTHSGQVSLQSDLYFFQKMQIHTVFHIKPFSLQAFEHFWWINDIFYDLKNSSRRIVDLFSFFRPRYMQHTFWPSFIAIGLVLFSKNANSYRFSYKAV